MTSEIMPFEGKDRRLMLVYVAQQYILELLRTGTKMNIEILNGVPQNAMYVRDFYDYQMGAVAFVFWHPSFEHVPVGSMIPALDVHIKRIVETEQT